ISSFTISPTAVIGGGLAIGTVRINSPAPAPGADIAVTSSTSLRGISSVITIPAGATGTTFPLLPPPVAVDTTVKPTTKLNTSTATASLRILAPVIQSARLLPNSVLGGGTADLQVTLSGVAAAGGVVVKLTSSAPTVATLPASVTV